MKNGFSLISIVALLLTFDVLPGNAQGSLISNLSVNSGATYQVASGLSVGSTTYVDRSYTYTTVPSAVTGATYIRTANNDKFSTGSAFLSFSVNQDVTVYVAYHTTLPRPAWLTGFSDAGMDLTIPNVTLRLYAKAFAAGSVVLGGNEGTATNHSMYTVVVLPSGSGSFCTY